MAMCDIVAEAAWVSAKAGSSTAVQQPDSDASTESELASDPGSLLDEDTSITVHTVALFLIDWDDTLFPTTWLSKQKLMKRNAVPSDAQWAQLESLAVAAAETLEAAASQGHVIIVTNAVEGWVQQSCLRYMPSLAPVLQRFSIVSARSRFEQRGVHCPTEWKCLAFEQEVEGFASLLPEGSVLSIIAMGDSVHEHRAALRAAQLVPGCCAKSLKFAERPSLDDLLEEHALVAGSLEDVVEYTGDLDVDIATSA